MQYEVTLLVVTKGKEEWQTCITFIDTVIPTREERRIFLSRLVPNHAGVIGKQLRCIGCKDPIDWDTLTAVSMTHYFAVPLVYVCAVSLCCPKGTCKQEASAQASTKWKEIRSHRGDKHMIRSCAHCHSFQQDVNTTFPVCGRCKAVHYCSAVCQKAAWKGHKVYCFDAASRQEV